MDEAKLELSEFYGSETFTRYSVLSNSVLTEGCKYVAERAGAYWLFDTIDSYLNTKFKGQDVVSTLAVNRDNTAEFTMTSMDDEPLATQTIEFTDFPIEGITIWSMRNELGAHTHMLPSEY